MFVVVLPALASAEDVLSVANTIATAGDTSVAIPVDLTGPDLTVLAFNVDFDPSFCAALVDPTAMACTSDCSNGGASCAAAG